MCFKDKHNLFLLIFVKLNRFSAGIRFYDLPALIKKDSKFLEIDYFGSI